MRTTSTFVLLINVWAAVITLPLWANVQKSSDGQLRLAVIYFSEPPYIYTDNSAQYRGILPELGKALSRELGLDLTYLPTPRKDLERSVLDGI